ncbi:MULTISPECIES: hypothetical protein [unclassified Streptomyces]|uniref:hypothetical protein n=1 Tax=unclassified Streptomyces TaxID=2593676 RepID=UPI0036EE3516
MTTPRPPRPHGPFPHPDVMVDAGGEPWARVEPLLTRRCRGLPGDAVVELVTVDTEVAAAVVAWCAEQGHELVTDGSRAMEGCLRVRIAGTSEQP